jgi:GT2 family glycosyltransferase
MAPSVCAVVVTRNRLPLLRECLHAVLGQTRPPDHVLVVDNASTDGTPEAVRAGWPQVEVVELAVNEGGAGGFHEGIARATAAGWEWLWVMDDDTIPRPDALARLLEASDGLAETPALLASRIEWTDGRLHPMNLPRVDVRDLERLLDATQRSLLPMRWSTFPSLLIRRDAVERFGPPRKAFFIWSDDLDFTARILREERGYIVPGSVAVHKTATAHWPWEGGERFYYAVRNGLWLMRGDVFGRREKVRHGVLLGEQVVRFLRHERWRPTGWRVLGRGLRDGLVRPAPR